MMLFHNSNSGNVEKVYREREGKRFTRPFTSRVLSGSMYDDMRRGGELVADLSRARVAAGYVL